MVLAVNQVRIQTGFLECNLDSLLYLFLLRLLHSHLELIVLHFLRNRLLIERNRLHGSHLHCHLVSQLRIFLVELNHCGESVLTHVVVHLDVIALKDVVSVELHLLARDARTLCDGILNSRSVGKSKSLHLVESVRLGSYGSVEYVACQLDEVGSVSHEVGLALQCHDSCEAVHLLHEHTSVGCLTV